MRSSSKSTMPWVILASLLTLQAAHAQPRPSPVDEFVGWSDDPSRQWLATAQLQRFPEDAIPRLLEPGRAVMGPHGSLTPALLTLAKIGGPAVPAINERIRAILRKDEKHATQDPAALIHVLGAIGPPAVPALVQASEMDDDWVTWLALTAIVDMEPRTSHYGQVLSPWLFWRPADDHVARLERAIVLLLPRIEKSMDRARPRLDADTPWPGRPAPYLLARWGGASQRARGLLVLEGLVRSAKHFYNSIDVIRLLYALDAPSTPSLIRLTAPKVPRDKDLSAAYLLSMAVALHGLGERDYGDLVDEAIRIGRPADRIDAVMFLGQSEDLSNVPRLIPLLDDRTEWSGRVVGHLALEALRLLTLEDLSSDRDAWEGWLTTHRNMEYGTLLEQWITLARRTMNEVPIRVANAWVEKISTSRDLRVLPLVADYLRRPDIHTSSPTLYHSTFVLTGGPNQMDAPPVVALLLRLAQQGVSGAVDALQSCLRATSPRVRDFGAMALAAYRPRQALEHLAPGLQSPEAWHRDHIARLLLMLGDARGIGARVDALALGSGMYGQRGIGADGKINQQARELTQGVRMSACLELRVYTQQPLACDPNATGDALAGQVGAWRSWWNASRAKFTLKTHQARLDLENMYRVRPITIGEHISR